MPLDKEIGASEAKTGKKRELVPYADTRSDSKTREIEAFDEEEEKTFVPGSFDQYKHRGIESGYREEYYTTKLDTSKISGEELRQAKRIEQVNTEATTLQDILRTQAKNKHVAQERGQIELDEGEEREEEMFSNVHRE